MKILNYGSCNIDYVYSLNHVVTNGETEQTDSMSVFPGGKGLNQSIAMARAGAFVHHAGCIGEGGAFLREILENNGVNTDFITEIEEKNGHAVIQVTEKGDNAIFLYPGSNFSVTPLDIDKTLAFFSSGDFIVLQNEISNVNYIIEKAHERGIKVIFNPSPISENILKIDFKKISYLLLNQVEAELITGCSERESAISALIMKNPELSVVLTLGSEGCLFGAGEERIFQPSFPAKVVDTTAAGDTFTGYFIFAITAGKSIKEALEISSCAAAIAVSRKGAEPSIPKIDEVNKALSKKQYGFGEK